MASWWSNLMSWISGSAATPLRPMPGEPHVFECHSCGKVFDAGGQRALCPECDSTDVERVG